MPKLLSPVKERNLIKHSSILEQYPILIKFYNENPELMDDQLDSLDEETKRFFKDGIYDKVSSIASSEWEVDRPKMEKEFDESKDISCQICNANLKNICYIKNKFNNNTLRIGTSCVTHFGMISKKEIDEIFKRMHRIKKLEELNKYINNIERIINNSDLVINKSPIVIKDSVKNKLLKLKLKAEELFDEFLDNDLDDNKKLEIINLLKEIIKNLSEQEQIISEYIDLHKNNKLVVTKKMMSNLRNYDVRDILNKDGFVTEKSIFKINNFEFIKSMVQNFNIYLESHNMKIVDVIENNANIYYRIDIDNRGFILLDYKYDEFALTYGSLIFNEEPLEDININNIFKYSKIKSEVTIKSLIDEMEFILKDKDLDIEDININFDEIIIRNAKNKKYIRLRISQLISEFKDLLITYDRKRKSDLIRYVLNQKDILSKGEYYDHKKMTNL